VTVGYWGVATSCAKPLLVDDEFRGIPESRKDPPKTNVFLNHQNSNSKGLTTIILGISEWFFLFP